MNKKEVNISIIGAHANAWAFIVFFFSSSKEIYKKKIVEKRKWDK